MKPALSRYVSVPERLGGFGIAVAVAALAWPAVTERAGVGLPCPLRWSTGIPCPACGLTTAAVALVRGDATAAFGANPAVFGLFGLTLLAVSTFALRAAGVLNAPAPWPVAARGRMRWAVGLLAAASWIYQLHRLGVGWA